MTITWFLNRKGLVIMSVQITITPVNETIYDLHKTFGYFNKYSTIMEITTDIVIKSLLKILLPN